jgi:hypothetical protein
MYKTDSCIPSVQTRHYALLMMRQVYTLGRQNLEGLLKA